MNHLLSMVRLGKGVACMAMVLSLVGCALGPTQVEVAHSPFEASKGARVGSILVKEFSDSREAGHRQTIGNKRNGFGSVLGSYVTKQGVKFETLLTQHFVEALQNAGYNAAMQTPGVDNQVKQFDAVLSGEIADFWVDAYMAVWHSVDVKLTLKDPTEARVLWQREIRGEQTNVLLFGFTSEIEKVVRQSLDMAMAQTLKEFSSDEFQSAVKQRP